MASTARDRYDCILLVLIFADTAIIASIMLEPVVAIVYFSAQQFIPSSVDKVSELAAVVTAIATLCLVWVARQQLRTVNWQQRQWATLQACDRYDSEAVFNKARRDLRLHMKGISQQCPLEVEMAYTTIFNYFDAVAIGIQQNLYIEEIAQEHIGVVLKNWMQRVDSSSDRMIVNLRKDFSRDFPYITVLFRKWHPQEAIWLNQTGHV